MQPLTEHEADLVLRNPGIFPASTQDEALSIRERRLHRIAYGPPARDRGAAPRPHPDRLIEAARPDAPKSDRAAEIMARIGNVILGATAVTLGVLFFALWFAAWADTGEACPGAADGWLGFCADVEGR